MKNFHSSFQVNQDPEQQKEKMKQADFNQGKNDPRVALLYSTNPNLQQQSLFPVDSKSQNSQQVSTAPANQSNQQARLNETLKSELLRPVLSSQNQTPNCSKKSSSYNQISSLLKERDLFSTRKKDQSFGAINGFQEKNLKQSQDRYPEDKELPLEPKNFKMPQMQNAKDYAQNGNLQLPVAVNSSVDVGSQLQSRAAIGTFRNNSNYSKHRKTKAMTQNLASLNASAPDSQQTAPSQTGQRDNTHSHTSQDHRMATSPLSCQSKKQTQNTEHSVADLKPTIKKLPQQIVFLDIPEMNFSDHLTKYASQGFILNEIQASQVYQQVFSYKKNKAGQTVAGGKVVKGVQLMTVYSGVWEKNLYDQMWACHYGKTLDEIKKINNQLLNSEEGAYLPSRVSKLTAQSGIKLFNCIWKVPLENEAINCSEPPVLVEFNLTQSELHDRCIKFQKMDYRVQAIVGEAGFCSPGAPPAAVEGQVKHFEIAQRKHSLQQKIDASVAKDRSTPQFKQNVKELAKLTNLQKHQLEVIESSLGVNVSSLRPKRNHQNNSIFQPLSLNNCGIRTNEITYAVIWVKNPAKKRYAFIYNYTQAKYFQKFEDCRRNGLALEQLNVFKLPGATGIGSQLNNFRFDAVFVEQQTCCVVSPFKGMKVDEFTKAFQTLKECFSIKSFSTLQHDTQSLQALQQYHNPGAYFQSQVNQYTQFPNINNQQKQVQTGSGSNGQNTSLQDLYDQQFQSGQKCIVYAVWKQVGDPFNSHIYQSLPKRLNSQLPTTSQYEISQTVSSPPPTQLQKRQKLQNQIKTSKSQSNKIPQTQKTSEQKARQNSAPPTKVIKKDVAVGAGILAWPLPKNRPCQKGNGSIFDYQVTRPKVSQTKFKSIYHKYLHDRIWEDFILPTNRVGLAIVYAIEGKVVYQEGFGYADYEEKVPMTTAHLQRVASISKEITDAAINLLVKDGKLTLQARLFGPGGVLNDTYKNTSDPEKCRYLHMVTVEHCMKHTAGQPWNNITDDPPFRLPKLNQHELLQWCIDNRQLVKRPGGAYHYSNIGYLFLGRVIEKVTGENYFDFIKKKIMDPIGATDFILANDQKKDKHPMEVTYYPLEFKVSPYSMKVTRADSAYGLAITPRDCVKFAHNWVKPAHSFRGGINGTQTIIYNTRKRHQCAIFLNTRTMEKPQYKELIEEFGRKIPDDQWPGLLT